MSLKVNEKSQNLILLFFYAIIKIENNGEIYNMEYIGIILLLLFSIFLFYQIKKLKKEIQEKDRLIENEYQELKKEKEEQLNNEVKGLVFQKNQLQSDLNGLNNSIKEKETFNNSLLRIREDELNSLMREKEEKARLHIKHNLEQYYVLQRAEKESQLKAVEEASAAEKEKLQTEINELALQLYDFKERRDTINEEIRRGRALEENQAFYKMTINDLDKRDIEILKSASLKLSKPDAVNKIIWSGYYQKPLADLRKRLLPKGDISGIYKITRLKTGEVYIGQTVSMDKRWQDHTKSALGVGTLASSQLHRVMAEDGPENFLFEVLEETPKEKLRERESFYIDFYDSKNYGLNSMKGDQNGN